MKKHLSLFLILILLLTFTAGCGKTEAPAPTPEAPPAEESPVQTQDWATVEEGAGILRVALPLTEDSSYSWNFTCSAPDTLELINSTTQEGFVATFRALADGEATLVFTFCRASSVAESRVVRVRTEGDKVCEILMAETYDMGGAADTPIDPELLHIRNANSVENVLSIHDSSVRVSEYWLVEDGVENWQYLDVSQYYRDNGEIVVRQKSENDLYLIDSVIYRGEGTPAGYYSSMDNGTAILAFMPNNEYEIFVNEYGWIHQDAASGETILKTEVNEEYGLTLYYTEIIDEVFDLRQEFIYFVDTATGLLEGIEQTDYYTVSGEKIAVTRSNIFYDELRDLGGDPIAAALDPNGCHLRLVINPGEIDEEVIETTLSREALVEFHSYCSFTLYADEACTQPIDGIDVTGDEAVAYVKLEK